MCLCLERAGYIFVLLCNTIYRGVAGSSVIFYYRKAQVENAVKLQLYSLEEMYKLREKYPTQSSVEMTISSQEAKIQGLVDTYDSESTAPVDIQG